MFIIHCSISSLADKAGVANSSLLNLAVGIHGTLGCHVGCSNCGVVVLSHIHMMVSICCAGKFTHCMQNSLQLHLHFCPTLHPKMQIKAGSEEAMDVQSECIFTNVMAYYILTRLSLALR